MMKIRKAAALLLALTIMLAFSGCGKMTAVKLAVKMAAAIAESPMTSEKMEMDFDMSIGAQGITMDMEMDMVFDMVMAMDPYRAYMDMEVGMNLLGQNVTQTMQTYVQAEDGTVTTYTYSDSLDYWTKTVVDVSEDEMTSQQSSYDWLAAKPVEELTLAEQTQTIGEQEVYVLSCTVTGGEMQKMLNSMTSVQDTLEEAGMSGLDMSALTVPAVFYVDTKTFLPVQIELEIQGMDEMMAGMMEQILGEEVALLGLEFEISQIRAVITDIGYDAAEVPQVPQEALDTAVEA